MDRVEYLRRELTPETSPADLDEFGREGWQLCAIDRGVGWFKRSRVARNLEEQRERDTSRD